MKIDEPIPEDNDVFIVICVDLVPGMDNKGCTETVSVLALRR